MNSRIPELIDLLKLETHPGGGSIREIYRSSKHVHLPGTLDERSALTTVYYLLAEGEYDCWHRLEADEAWHYIEGDPLELIWFKPGDDELTPRHLGEVGESSSPIAVVPGGCWQMARTTGEYTLVSCMMGPGFEYEDYQQMWDNPEVAQEVQRRFPELAEYI